MNIYLGILVNHPCKVVWIIGTFSLVVLIISISCTNLPNFSDPQLGFETRGTEIAKRLIAWENLFEALRPSGILSVNPLTEHPLISSAPFLMLSQNKSKKIKSTYLKKNKKTKLNSNISFIIKERPMSGTNENNYNFKHEQKINKKNFEPNSIEQKNEHNYNSEFEHNNHEHEHEHISNDGFFCEGLNPEYSHVVVESTNPSQSLLSVDMLISICTLQEKLMNNEFMSSICQTVSSGHCCNPWSLPNYIMLLNNFTDCFNITEDSILETSALLHECVKYFNDMKLSSDCYETRCHNVPTKCVKFNAVYNIFYYLTDLNFSSTNYSLLNDSNIFLGTTMIFLPIARSSAALPYYYNLSSSVLKDKNVFVSAMDLGLKNALFNDCLLRDAFLMVAGGSFMIICIWLYTASLFITISTLLAILMSLTTSYFVYTICFNIKFFPFMNLLAVIVSIGIGADDAFIFYKIWQNCNENKINSSLIKQVSSTLKHSFISMFVTSLTTAAAFYSSSVSSITAINCFSIFAGTAVLANFLLMITWLPACFVIAQRNFHLEFWRWLSQIGLIKTFRDHVIQEIRSFIDKYFIFMVIRLKWLWLLFFSTLAVGGAVVVLHYPKLKLPDSRNFHLFQSRHLFEKYDLIYKERFRFERHERVSIWDHGNTKLPLRFVWGIKPVDNGNYFEPNSKGTLEFDPSFDIVAPESQEWLLRFCRLLRNQPFYQPTIGPLLPNCFIESFKNWMHRRCKDVIGNIDRTPCCESSEFPYSRKVFEHCIAKAINSLYETPAEYFLPGVAGPKFSKTRGEEIKVVVVEYDSNYSYSMSFKDMHNFFTEVETWFQNQLLNAPPGLKNGWFVSHLDFYDLQLALSDGTSVAIGVSMVTSLAVSFLVSLNLLISIYTIVTISCIIFVSVGVLVLIGWSLNILESIAVTTAIGLAVDFSLHYGINYGLSVENNRDAAVKSTLDRMGGPTLMAALTTGAAGFFMLPSTVLPYIQIGIFLLIVMTLSWIYSTMFLMPLLSVVGPRKDFCQFSYRTIFSYCHITRISSPPQNNKIPLTNVLTEPVLFMSNVTEDNEQSANSPENHEMEIFVPCSR